MPVLLCNWRHTYEPEHLVLHFLNTGTYLGVVSVIPAIYKFTPAQAGAGLRAGTFCAYKSITPAA